MQEVKKDNSENSKYSFWKLINEYKITIPIMQRDYAQGRKTDNVNSIRIELLESIYCALINEENLDFDFVYGSLTEHGLCPLDGQQRLTTLFLLHWYIASKENHIEEIRSVLNRFSYETRISSREFCSRLVEMNYTPLEKQRPTQFIKNQYSYFDVWDKDPTISAMLVMLDAIHEKFFAVEKELFPLLTRAMEDDPLITFSYLPMENYALTDDLYIKMNSRGKNLSNFENFKAKFLQHLKKNELPYEHFEESIDRSWTDLFWDYRSSWDNTFDEEFMNVFTFFTEMINLESYGVRDGSSPFAPEKIRGLIDFYDTEEKVVKLYDLMDLWKSKKEIDECFQKTFSNQYEKEKVRIFDDSSNLFESVINGKRLKEYNKVILYAFMQRLIYYEKTGQFDLNLSGYVRVVRNFVMKVRSRKNYSYNSDFRYGRHGSVYVRFALDKLLDKDDIYETLIDLEDDSVNAESLKYEKEKACFISDNYDKKEIIFYLEDLDEFQTCIQNIMPYVREAKEDIKMLPENIRLLFQKQYYNQIVRAMLSIGDYGINLGSSRYGNRCYYGNKYSNWNTILSLTGNDDYPRFLSEFLRQYFSTGCSKIGESLDRIIENNIGKYSSEDWIYYFLKYPSLLDDSDGVFNDRIIILQEKNGDVIIPHYLNGVRLYSFHKCAFYFEVEKQMLEKHNMKLDAEKEKSVDSLGGIVFDSGIEVRISAEKGVMAHCEEGADSEVMVEVVNEIYNETVGENMDYIEQLVVMCEAVIKSENELS